MLTHALTQPAILINTETNEYGDQETVDETSCNIRFRYVTEIDRGVNREGLMSPADAMIWCSPTLPVVEGSIFKVDDKYWRVNRLIKARRLSGDTVFFLKALVNVHTMA